MRFIGSTFPRRKSLKLTIGCGKGVREVGNAIISRNLYLAIIGIILFVAGGIFAYYGFYMGFFISAFRSIGDPAYNCSGLSGYFIIGIIGIIIAIIGGIIGIIGFRRDQKSTSDQQAEIQSGFSNYYPTNYYCHRCNSLLYWADMYRSYYCSKCNLFIPSGQGFIDRAISSLERESNK